MQETLAQFLGREDLLEKGKATSLQYSGLENSMDCRVHGVTKVTTEQFSLSLPSKYWQSPWQLPLLLSPTQESWCGSTKNTGVGSLSLLRGNFPTQELSQGLLHCRWILYQLSYQGRSPYVYIKVPFKLLYIFPSALKWLPMIPTFWYPSLCLIATLWVWVGSSHLLLRNKMQQERWKVTPKIRFQKDLLLLSLLLSRSLSLSQQLPCVCSPA